MRTLNAERLIERRLREFEDWRPVLMVKLQIANLTPIEYSDLKTRLDQWRHKGEHPMPDVLIRNFGLQYQDRIETMMFDVEATRPLGKTDLTQIVDFVYEELISQWVRRPVRPLRGDMTIQNVRSGMYDKNA